MGRHSLRPVAASNAGAASETTVASSAALARRGRKDRDREGFRCAAALDHAVDSAPDGSQGRLLWRHRHTHRTADGLQGILYNLVQQSRMGYQLAFDGITNLNAN